MPDDHDELRDFSWRHLLPWLILQRALRTSLAPQLLLLATLGCLLNPIGWNVATLLFEYDSPAGVDSNSEDEAEEGTAEETDKPEQAAKPEPDGDQDKDSDTDSNKSEANSGKENQSSSAAEESPGTSLQEILQREFAAEQAETAETAEA